MCLGSPEGLESQQGLGNLMLQLIQEFQDCLDLQLVLMVLDFLEIHVLLVFQGSLSIPGNLLVQLGQVLLYFLDFLGIPVVQLLLGDL